jgi:hypothetical protein
MLALSENGGSIYCYDCLSFVMEDSTITDSRAFQGGALFLEQSEIGKTQ